MPAGTKKNLLTTVKENPVISTLAAFALVMTTITGTLTATGQLDSLIVTEAELQPVADQVEENKNWNQCHRLELQLERFEDRLWERQHADNPDEESIRDIEREIARLTREFNAKNCAEILDG